MTQETSPDLNSIRIKTTEAFRGLIDNPENTQLWEQFRFTYEERRKHSWLAESEQGPLFRGQNGLAKH